MGLPYWVVNEMRSRKRDGYSFEDLKPYELVIRYVDERGRNRFLSRQLSSGEAKLDDRVLKYLVASIEDKHRLPLEKGDIPWFDSFATNSDDYISDLKEYTT